MTSGGSRTRAKRFPPLADDEMTDAQRELAQAYRGGWRNFLTTQDGGLGGPLDATLRSPGFARAFMGLSDYVHEATQVPDDVKELVVLMVARDQLCGFEWLLHEPQALKAGLSRETVRAICDRRRPMDLTPEQNAVFNAVSELIESRKISEPSFRGLKQAVGEELFIDIVGMAAYFTALSMLLNATQVVHVNLKSTQPEQ